jgi:hypothetical protein
MDFRKSDIFILAGFVLAVAAAGDLVRHNIGYGLGLLVFLVFLIYTTGLRRGIKRRQD